MPTPLRRSLRRARRAAWYAIAIALVVMALAAGAMSQLLPLAERHPERIAEWLGARANRTVAFDRVETQWTRRGPLLRLDGLRIGDGDDAIPIGAAEVLVSQYAGLLPGRSFTELRLRGLQLTLERGGDGRWQVRGLPGQSASGGDPFAALEGLGELQVIDGRLTVLAPAIGIEASLPEVDLRLRVDGDRVRAAARAWTRAGAAPVDIAAEFDRERGDGRAWFALRRADLSAWPALPLAGITPASGAGRLSAWTELRGNRVTAVVVEGRLEGVGLRGEADADGVGASPLAFGDVDVRARWQLVDGGWQLVAPRLRIGSGDEAQVLDGLLVAGGARRALLAGRVDAGPLLALAALSARTPPALRRWLRTTRPDAVLHDVEVLGGANGALHASAGVEDLGFAAVGEAPGLSGLSGKLRGDGAGLVFEFDPRATMRFDWPAGFGPAHDVRLRGRLAGWREGDGWRVETPALRVDGDGYGVDARGGMVFEGDGSLPRIDLAADVDGAEVPVAKRFWVRHRMPRAAVEWLDAALVSGEVHNGRGVVSGDLDDWPFRRGGARAAHGLFHAEADLADVTLKFQPDWPAAEDLDAHVAFIADGFEVKGKAKLGGVAATRLEGGIADFGNAELRVDADVAGDTGGMLDVLRASPLSVADGDVLTSIAASGPAAGSFAMLLPLHDRAAANPSIDGSVALRGAKLLGEPWQLAFDDVRGEVAYDEHGFHAGELLVRHGGRPGRLALRAGDGHVRDPKQAFEAELQARLPTTELAARAPQLAWLGERLSGQSDWTAAFAMPAGAAGGDGGRLQLRSDLVGTRIDLPAPLRKEAAVGLPARIDVQLPFDDGEVAVALGERVALRSRSANNRTGVRVVLGSGRVAEAPPASGLVASGRTDALDLIEWAAVAGGDRGAGGEGLLLRQVDVVAGRLHLLGGVFADTRVVATPAAGGTRVGFEGETLAGSLLLPEADGATLSARLQRMHWRSAKAAGAAEEAVGAVAAARAGRGDRGAAANDDFDPARIPSLDIAVDDLRVGEAVLGRASLQSRRVPAGMRIERLQARAPKQDIDASGEWFGRGAAARTRLEVGIDSRDVGELLAGFGMDKRMEGGRGEARFEASWPGNPAGFRLDALEGELSVAVKDGHLVEVRPGAGRVLGLLSIAELPRRLMLDFSDFFDKGFAFNRIGGNVRFADGQARSDDLVIDGPAAEIHIRGAADLRAQRYDQTIEVLPKTGNLLTAVGAITAGPVGAAVGAVANAVLNRPLGQMGAKVYRVTGPWKDPKVEVAGRDPPGAPVSSREPAPPPG